MWGDRNWCTSCAPQVVGDCPAEHVGRRGEGSRGMLLAHLFVCAVATVAVGVAAHGVRSGTLIGRHLRKETRETSFQWWQSAFERLAARLPACSRAFREVTTAPGRPWRTSSTTVCARTPDVAPSRRSLVITLSENHSVITFQWGGACFEVVVHAYLTIHVACTRGMRSSRPAHGAPGRPMGAL